MKVIASLVLSSLVAVVHSRPQHQASVKGDASTLRDSYDFVIAGGGIVGLTVADRLSAAFPDKTVLVIEYGENKYAPGSFDPDDKLFGLPPVTDWNTTGPVTEIPSIFLVPLSPIKDLAWRVGSVPIGKQLGGGGAVNGQFFDRGSRFDYDAWAALGSPEFDSKPERWDWAGLTPYFRKSMTFTPPLLAVAQEIGYTWDASLWDNTTPVHISYPPFQWGDTSIARRAWKEMGIEERPECANGDKDGICWVPTAQDPITALRSHSAIAHYDAVKETRNNYDLLVSHQVVRIAYVNGTCSKPPVVEVKSLADNGLFNVTAEAEVIFSAGAIHTPTILQRSGIGPKSFLDSAEIKTIVNLPGVGSNYQDHWGPRVSWEYADPEKFSRDFFPLPAQMNNETFFNEAVAAFAERPARGPYTLAQSMQAMYLPLANMTTPENLAAILGSIRTAAASPLIAASYLPADQAAEPSLVAGYQHQLNMLADLLENPRVPSVEATFPTGTKMDFFILHPLSRGTVRIDPSKPLGLPVIDARFASNPVDMDLQLAHLKFIRKILDTEVFKAVGARETAPAESVQDEAGMLDYIRQRSALTFAHPCCTAPMLPRNKGGVVDPELKVYGVHGLRVADLSAMPMLVSAHLSTTAYAFGEKAASIIIKHWSS